MITNDLSFITISYTQIAFINTPLLNHPKHKCLLKINLFLPTVLLSFISFSQEIIGDTIHKPTAPLKIYPIPANRSLFIEWENIDNYEVKLYNSYGKRVLAAIPHSTLHKIELQTTHLPNGMYLVRIFASKKLKATKRIIIQH